MDRGTTLSDLIGSLSRARQQALTIDMSKYFERIEKFTKAEMDKAKQVPDACSRFEDYLSIYKNLHGL
jgi:hypothetical protein